LIQIVNTRFCNKTENTAKNCCQNYAKNVMLRRSFVIIPVSNFYEDNISKKKKTFIRLFDHTGPVFREKKILFKHFVSKAFPLACFFWGGSIKYSYSFYNLEGVLYFALSRESSLQHINAIYAGRIEQS